MDRLFATETGQRAANIVGNEDRTLGLIGALAAEIWAEVLGLPPGGRAIAVPGEGGAPPSLLVLDPARDPDAPPGLATPDVAPDHDQLARMIERLSPGATDTRERSALDLLLRGGPDALADALWIAEAEVVVVTRPPMIRLAVPVPVLDVTAGGQVSTAGLVCRDAHGTLGVTACAHGTGPVGTAVSVGLTQTVVAAANETQDLAFLPMPPGWNIPGLAARAGVRQDRPPAQSDPVRFEGVTSGPAQSFVMGHDLGLLRRRPSLQLKVQTRADTNPGDSGAALIDGDDRVIGFAFERTAYGAFPEFADWIWAANALDALGLTPI